MDLLRSYKLPLLRNWNGEGDVAQIVSSNNMKKYHRRDGTLVHKVLDNPCPCEKYTGSASNALTSGWLGVT